MAVNSYYSRKLHSLLGVVPIGFFLIVHFLTNYEATKGNGAFIKQVEWIHNLPFLFFLELLFIWLPLLYHGIYGLYVAYQARNNVTNYGYFRNWMFALQRVTGVLTFIFIVWHTFETRVQVGLGNVEYEGLGELMHSILTQPVFATLYIIGIIAATFHFCNGLWSFLVSWGITVGPRAQRVSTYVTMGLFVIMSIIGIMALAAFMDPNFTAKGV
ncbi:succinate dehydrogenase cytochrome b558 subunit [Ferviditalea candida]|uniref:Succinate dehydrogenase cytochrome b558 subunit n=1 Tax=Ferviditalea candida TaxID=3108399 RepID=A0ABU5ZGN1_9BACL|nr:succinate dehydrogenase cytochrome b558 subunit [Paenibacillaceae bacterium T2]